MITVSQTYQDILDNGGQYEWQIINGASTFSKVNLISGKITRTCYEQLSVGNVIAAQLDLELRDVTVDTDSILQVQFRATDGSSSSSWYTKGYFFIDTVESSPYSDITKITAFDAILKTETPYQTSGEWIPTTDAVVIQRIVSDMGVVIDPDTLDIFGNDPIMLTAPLNIGTDGTTEREVLSYLGAMRGGNWYIGYDGKLYLQLLSPTATDTAAVGDAVVSFDASPTETIKRLRVWTTDNTCYIYPPLPLQTHTPEDITDHNAEALLVWANSYVAGWEEIGGRCIDVKIPFWCDYSIGADLFAQLENKAFIPFSAEEVYLDPKYEVGDGITIKDVTSIIANCTSTLNPLSPCDISLQKEDVINSYYPYKSTVQRTMEYNIAQNTATLAEHTSQILANAQAIEDVPSEIERATTLITGGFGGYVKWTYLTDGTPSELLFMDSPDESTAVNILRINRNGIGFSTDGGNTYANAWTIDGKLNADFIKTGTLDASQVNVENINADNITSGTIDAIAINGSTITGGTISGTTITSNGTLPNGASGTATMSGGQYDGTALRSGTISSTAHYAADSLSLKGVDTSDNYTAQIDMFADGEYGAQIHLSATNEGDTYITPSGITIGGKNVIAEESQGVTLWSGTKVTSGTVTLSDSLANYTWLSFTFNTNVDKAYEFVRRADFDSGNLMKTWSAGSWNGSRFQYNTWVQLTKVSDTSIRVSNGYNDANWQGGLVAVYGFTL